MKALITEQEFTRLISDGVRDFSNYRMEVTELHCNDNQLTALPELPRVTELWCSDNQLKALPELPLVTELYCSGNQLTALPELPLVTELYCSHNELTALPNYTESQTSGRSVVYINGKVLTGCFCGTPDEFYQKGYVQERKEWVKEFYNKIKSLS